VLAADNMASNPRLLKEFEIEFGALTGSLDMTAKGQSFTRSDIVQTAKLVLSVKRYSRLVSVNVTVLETRLT